MTTLKQLSGNAGRVAELFSLMKDLRRQKEAADSNSISVGDCIEFDDVTIRTPKDVMLVEHLTFSECSNGLLGRCDCCRLLTLGRCCEQSLTASSRSSSPAITEPGRAPSSAASAGCGRSRRAPSPSRVPPSRGSTKRSSICPVGLISTHGCLAFATHPMPVDV